MRLLAACTLAVSCFAQSPEYSLDSLVDAAANRPGRLAPNSRATLYGKNLLVTNSGPLRVRLGTYFVDITYASPDQVNFIVPDTLATGARLQLVVLRDGMSGPVLPLTLQPEAPELFVMPDAYALAARPSGSLISPTNPASPGSIVVLYANGLGPTLRGTGRTSPALTADPILTRLDVWLDDRRLPADHLLYAGVAPGYVALYQINLLLPEDAGPNPLIQLGFRGEISSRPGVRLAVGSSGNAPAP